MNHQNKKQKIFLLNYFRRRYCNCQSGNGSKKSNYASGQTSQWSGLQC